MENYDAPSTLDADRAKLEAAGLDLLFAPNLAELYPGGIEEDTRVTVPALSDILCGEFRPGHFSGVATVVSKLFINTQPDFALFGEKDFQQVMVIRRMVRDLLYPVEIIGMPIIREADGLAMSSRNSYLKPEERQVAAGIFASLTRAATELREHKQDIAALEARCLQELSALGMRPEYISVRSALDLSLPKAGDKDLIILAAAWLGGARCSSTTCASCSTSRLRLECGCGRQRNSWHEQRRLHQDLRLPDERIRFEQDAGPARTQPRLDPGDKP